MAIALGAIALGTLAAAQAPPAAAPVPTAQLPDQGPMPTAIATLLSELATEETPNVREDSIAAFEMIESFYSRRGFEPVWSDSARAQALINAVRDSADDGLSPGDYHFTSLVRMSNEVAQAGATDFQRAEFDILMTDAAIRLGYHLWFGKVDPTTFDPGWNMARRVPGFDPVVEIEKALASPDLAARISEHRPDQPIYTGLMRELARFNTIALRGGWEAIPAGATLKPGADDPRVPALRARLVATGELPEAAAAAAAGSTVYDPALEQAVREFQRRMGMTPDGVIGPATLVELNVPVEQRIRQLRVNLDRGRVLLYDLPPEFVVVNIASQEVHFAQEGKLVWTSRAQVGKQYRQTPEYRSAINYLVFNPTWTVPPGIIRNDILPAAKRDPNSITRKGLRVLDGAGREVSPTSVDWSRFTSGNIPYTLRQDPGPKNALGRVKFMFPNPHAVYLHDTPSQSAFDLDTRTTSSGCVRVAKPFELAERLLNDPVKWSRARIDAAVDSGTLQNVTLAKPVPVLLAYWTAWVDAGGALHFRPDVYGRDAKWSKALDAPFSFRREPLN
jgi:L,D-transpeptidase YcbB